MAGLVFVQRELVINFDGLLVICAASHLKKNVALGAKRFPFFRLRSVAFQHFIVQHKSIFDLTKPAFDEGLFIARGPPQRAVFLHDLTEQNNRPPSECSPMLDIADSAAKKSALSARES